MFAGRPCLSTETLRGLSSFSSSALPSDRVESNESTITFMRRDANGQKHQSHHATGDAPRWKGKMKHKKRMNLVRAAIFIGICAVGSSASANSGASRRGPRIPAPAARTCGPSSPIINGIVSGAAAGKRRLSAGLTTSIRHVKLPSTAKVEKKGKRRLPTCVPASLTTSIRHDVKLAAAATKVKSKPRSKRRRNDSGFYYGIQEQFILRDEDLEMVSPADQDGGSATKPPDLPALLRSATSGEGRKLTKRRPLRA